MADQSPAAGGKGGRRRRRKKKKKKVGSGEAAAAPTGPAVAAVAPPRSPREFSSNWKALQELLKQKADGSSESPSTCQAHSKKKHPLKAGHSQDIPAVNGKGDAAKAKPADKADGGSAKDSPPLAKPKAKRAATDKNLSGTKSGGKGCEEKKKNGDIPKEKGDIKHKRRKAEEHAEQQPKEAEIWFDDVDPKDIEAAIGPEAAKIARRNLGLETGPSKQSVEQVLVKEKASEGLTRAVAMDCEMVGVGPKGEDSIVARVSLVNQFGKCIYDKYVKPTEEVTDYRTAVSGIRPENINKGEDFKTVQKEVADILNGRILVGHALCNDLKATRPSLKLLCEKLLNVQVQTSEHCSIQDAQAAMRLYTLEKKKWEAAIKNKPNNKNHKT